uniref:protein kinase domain-containing protein n=1 Tax=Nocardia abscessus TaxID=120957 RepID=UPI0024570286
MGSGGGGEGGGWPGAARGVEGAHGSGLLHRDVKPANILVSTADDGSDAVRITDFGIARPLEA